MIVQCAAARCGESGWWERKWEELRTKWYLYFVERSAIGRPATRAVFTIEIADDKIQNVSRVETNDGIARKRRKEVEDRAADTSTRIDRDPRHRVSKQ